MTLIFAIFDSKAEAFLTPFHAETKGLAMRIFESNVNNPESQFNAYPEDFHLFQIGRYLPEHGTLENEEANISLGCALEFIKRPEDQAKERAEEIVRQIGAKNG